MVRAVMAGVRGGADEREGEGAGLVWFRIQNAFGLSSRSVLGAQWHHLGP